MKRVKKFLTLGLAVALVFSLTACGGDNSGGGEGNSDVAAAIEQALSALGTVESYNLAMDMDMEMSAQGESLVMDTKAEGSYIADPMKMSLKMNMDMGELYGSMEMLMYADTDGTNFTTYMSADGGSTWTKQAMAGAEDFAQYDVEESLSLYMSNVESFKENGTEAINGSEATRYDGLISEAALNDVMETSGVDQQLASLNLSPEQAAEFYKDLGDLPISIWIDNESGLPVKYEMDMKQMMQKLMDNMMDAMGDETADVELTIDAMLISMTMSDYNNVADFEIPEAAKNAPEAVQ